MKFYLDGKEVNLDQLEQHLEELDNRDANYDEIYWRIALDYIKDSNLYFETMRFEDC